MTAPNTNYLKKEDIPYATDLWGDTPQLKKSEKLSVPAAVSLLPKSTSQQYAADDLDDLLNDISNPQFGQAPAYQYTVPSKPQTTKS